MNEGDQSTRDNGFNSSTIICENSEICEDVNYDPYEHRDKSHSYSSWGSLAHLLKSSLGTGMLAMPMAFKYSGLLVGVLGTILITFSSLHCAQIFVQTSRDVCKKKKIPSLRYGETVEYVFEINSPGVRKYGPFMRGLSEIFLSAACLGTGCSYIIFSAASFQSVINHELKVDWDVRFYIVVTIIPCLISGNIRNMKQLVPFSSISNICIITVFAITLWYILDSPMNISERPLFSGWEGIPQFFSTVIFAVAFISAVMPIENSMQKPKQFLGWFGILNIAMTTVMVLYVIIGFLGYVRYGDAVRDSVTLNLPNDSLLAEVAQILIGISVLFTFGLKFYVPMDLLWQTISKNIPKDKQNIWQFCIRTGCVILLGVICVAVPRIRPFIGLVGAVFMSTLGLLIPAIIETVNRYPEKLGFAHWILIKNILLALISILAAVTGAISNFRDILKLYDN